MGLGMCLKKILKEKGLTIKELSKISGVSINTLYSITKRDNNMARYDIIKKIASALDVSIEELTGEKIDIEAAETIKNARLHEIIKRPDDEVKTDNEMLLSYERMVHEIISDNTTAELFSGSSALAEEYKKKQKSKQISDNVNKNMQASTEGALFNGEPQAEKGLEILRQLRESILQNLDLSVLQAKELLGNITSLNEEGQQKVKEYVDDLSANPKYLKDEDSDKNADNSDK